jgi:hypothetical protein
MALSFLLLFATALMGIIVGFTVVGVRQTEELSLLYNLQRNFVSVALNASCAGADEGRRADAYQVRIQAAYQHYATALPCQTDNGDEALYAPVYFASFSKGLPHNGIGHVSQSAYEVLLQAVSTQLPSAWAAIPLAGGSIRKLVNPLASSAYVLQGADPPHFTIPAAPRFNSAEQAGELVEVYWMSLVRDVSFSDYATNMDTLDAVAELTALSDYRGPAPVTAQNLFRGTHPGCLTGPYISQFLYLSCPLGANDIDMRITPLADNVDYMTTFPTFLAQQNGAAPEATVDPMSPPKRYIINGRDLAHWVHVDKAIQTSLVAMATLMDIGAPLKSSLPYQPSGGLLNQEGFGTFGWPDIARFATASSDNALKSVWYQKWLVHRRLRPEAMGGLMHNHKTSAYSYPFHSEALAAPVLAKIFLKFGTYLLPQAFPEGSPLHPSYGQGHATFAGAGVTMLKALFVEDWVIPNPMQPNATDGGETLVPFVGTLTVGGELNKLANNIAIGRNIAGVHWRSDGLEGLKLGEAVAIELLRDLKLTYAEPFEGFSFTGFDGTLKTV